MEYIDTMKNKDWKLDVLIQKWASTQISAISGQRAECGHHIIGRSNHYLRWDKENILPCTMQEHDLIHRGILKVDNYVSPKRMGNLISKRADSLRWKPTEEFYEQKEKELKTW